MNRPAELYACVYVREFPAQGMVRLRPKLLAQPVAILEGEAPRQWVCSAENHDARQRLKRRIIPFRINYAERVSIENQLFAQQPCYPRFSRFRIARYQDISSPHCKC